MKELKNKFDMYFNENNHKIDMKVKKEYQVIISPLLQSMLGFRSAIFPGGGGGGGGVRFRLGSGPQERIKYSVRVLSDTVLSPVTTTISDRRNRYKGRHGFYSAIRKRTSGGDTSL